MCLQETQKENVQEIPESVETLGVRLLPSGTWPMWLCCKNAGDRVSSASIRGMKRSFFHEPAEPIQMASF